MEGNKDEARRCRDMGVEAFGKKDYEKALRYFLKAQRLFPLQEIPGLISEAERMSSTAQSDSADASSASRNGGGTSSSREDSASTSQGREASSRAGNVNDSTIQEVLCHSDLYKILGVPKESSSEVIKKAYRKLSLKVHPDKNSSPRAEEAFKAVSRAFQVLSDPGLRAQYDAEGPSMLQQPSPNLRRRRPGSSPWEGEEFDPNDVFQAFFGGNPHARVFRSHFRPAYRPAPGAGAGAGPLPAGLAQLLPLLALLLFGLAQLSLSPEPQFTLNRREPFVLAKETRNLGVPFFVQSAEFDQTHPAGSQARSRLDQSVEAEYRDTLENHCHYEKVQQSQLYRYGQRQRARAMELPHCTQLQELIDRVRQKRERKRVTLTA